ncbi:MAG: ABC transporter ATP-binding protein [Planctomycetes bacterium]|nr:ABC transporter ATP-binding protein [Planctomycetota bacterium]
MKAILQARDIVKDYSQRPEDRVLRGLSLDIAAGELLTIMGLSGVGKSTLLNILGLLDRPTSGSLFYQGRDPRAAGRNLVALPKSEKARLRNQIFGFVFQFYHLLPDLTVLENVTLPALVATGVFSGGAYRRRKREEAEALLEEVGIAHRRHARPRDLSGGEKQRAAIARALILEPEIVYCDEPTGNLDTRTGERIHDVLVRLREERGITFVIVTHDDGLASLGTRRIHMVDGLFPDDPGWDRALFGAEAPGADPAPDSPPPDPAAGAEG